ncbi:MAG: DNA-binding response regulator [Microbacteriaceae bacterium]|nr:DNA-binding response regulator [Microbacteriaceae bacterium]
MGRMNPTTSPRKILVVEDEPFMRELVCRALDDASFVTIPAGTATDAVKLFRLNDPDGAIVDIDLGAGPNGVMLATRLRRDVATLPLIFLTIKEDPRTVDGPSIPDDAHFLNKKRLSDVDALISVVDDAMRGTPGVVTRHDRTGANPLLTLTQDQVDVLRLIAEGLSNQQIADERGTTLRAAELLVSRTLGRVGIDEKSGNRRVLAARAFS